MYKNVSGAFFVGSPTRVVTASAFQSAIAVGSSVACCLLAAALPVESAGRIRSTDRAAATRRKTEWERERGVNGWSCVGRMAGLLPLSREVEWLLEPPCTWGPCVPHRAIAAEFSRHVPKATG